MTIVKIYRSEVTGRTLVEVSDSDKPDLHIFGYGSKEVKYFQKDPADLLLEYINRRVLQEWKSLRK